MRVHNISWKFTARKIDGAAKQQIFKIANWSTGNLALLREILRVK